MNFDKEIPILTAQIRAMYAEFDKRFHLHGANVPITFGYDEDLLGSYTRAGEDEKEHFHFSLCFVAYGAAEPLSTSDRADLYKHEYAHYMQFHMPIPSEYLFQPGLHGSAWKYCCSLVGAAPTPYYQVGESKRKHNYEKVLRNPINDKFVPLMDTRRREQAYQQQKNAKIQYQFGEEITHPKFGKGIIEKIEPTSSNVYLHIRFGQDVKKIDQKWLLRTKYKKVSDRIT